MSEVSYLAVDPGGLSKTDKMNTGYAVFDEAGDVIKMGQVRRSEFNKFFAEFLRDNAETLKHVIIEDYKNANYKKFGGHRQQVRNDTSKAIGGLEMVCDSYDIPHTLQPNTVYRIGAGWAGIEIPSNHDISHQFIAVSHGVYWLQQNGIRPVGKAIPDVSS